MVRTPHAAYSPIASWPLATSCSRAISHYLSSAVLCSSPTIPLAGSHWPNPPLGTSPSAGRPLPKHWLEQHSLWEALAHPPAHGELSVPCCPHAHIYPRPLRTLLLAAPRVRSGLSFPHWLVTFLRAGLGAHRLCMLRASYSRAQSDAPRNLLSERREMCADELWARPALRRARQGPARH